jgi:hypothetical protein
MYQPCDDYSEVLLAASTFAVMSTKGMQATWLHQTMLSWEEVCQ